MRFNSCYQLTLLSNSISADFSFYYCVYSVLSQLSRIVRNSGDSHQCSMYQNVQTCILEVVSTRIGLKLPVDIVWGLPSSLPHATRSTSNMHRSNKEHKNTWKCTRIYTWCIYQFWRSL